MAVTGVSSALREPLFSEVDKIVHSDVLRGSESLCHLLSYLASHSVSEQGSVKEHQIATEVFGRPADFDSRLDSTVRVQTSRLRAKLAEYYAGPGAQDEVIVEIPKGAYSVTVHSRSVPAPAVRAGVPQTGVRPVEEAPALRRSPYKIATWLLAICCGLLLWMVYVSRNRPAQVAEVRPEVPASLKALWHVFTDAPERTWVVFSNAEFVGRPETGLRYLDPAKDKGNAIFDHYTGIGEVMAIHELDQLFTQFRHGVVVKRGRLLAMDDVKNNDLIFIGSPSENLTLRDLPGLQEFQFHRLDSGSRKGDLGIANLHPEPGEQAGYIATKGLPLTEDYAVIGLMPGPTRQHWVMTLAGITTIGTQAAVEFVCSSTSVKQLLEKVRRSGAELLPFEAVIRVSVSRGVPVSSQLLGVHTRTP
ncbi:MAG TPA: hypothetical protein VK752_16000 [Bryobacteraceae bacterium]|jgi:hypothetical protein|nr:hypothetical protein [Bryobacteraceae bacterium]